MQSRTSFLSFLYSPECTEYGSLMDKISLCPNQYDLKKFFLPDALYLPVVRQLHGLQSCHQLSHKGIHVSDGNTLTVLMNSKEETTIRLDGIDCPEKCQHQGAGLMGEVSLPRVKERLEHRDNRRTLR